MSKPGIINIVGKTPFGDLLLQSAVDTNSLHSRLISYFTRTMGEGGVLNNVAGLQKILNMQASKVRELDAYEFEGNQRVYEVATILMLSQSINLLCEKSYIPAWQRPKQGVSMKALTEKESWDGFMYENPDDPSIAVAIIPIEIKSTMTDPVRTGINSPDQLLIDSLPQFEKHFQSQGSVCAVFVMPYPLRSGLRFNLKEVTIAMNKYVSQGATGCLCLLSFPKDERGVNVITLQCYLLSKDPNITPNGNIDHIDLTQMGFGKIH